MTDTSREAQLVETLRLHRLWLIGNPAGKIANLSEADLSRADLSRADLSEANLSEANLSGANLSVADLSRAYLSEADLSRADLSRADLSGANLSGANLSGANLNGAYLRGSLGNLCEIKSAQFDMWPITWTCSADGVTTLQIGCQRHALALWIKSDPRWIFALDPHATEWWTKYRDVVLALVAASPAVPHGGKHE